MPTPSHPVRTVFRWRGSLAVGALVGGTLLAVPCTSWAQASPQEHAPTGLAPGFQSDDVITLRDGTELHGHVAEVHPRQSVRLVMPDGASRDIAWGDVATAGGPSFLTPGTATAAGLAAPVPVGAVTMATLADPALDLLRDQPGRAPLTIHGPVTPREVSEPGGADVGMFMAGRWLGAWRTLCLTPCTLHPPPGPFSLLTRNLTGGGYARDTVNVPVEGVRVDLWPTATLAAQHPGNDPVLRHAAFLARSALRAHDEAVTAQQVAYQDAVQSYQARSRNGIILLLGGIGLTVLSSLVVPISAANGELSGGAVALGVGGMVTGLVVTMVGTFMLPRRHTMPMAPAPVTVPAPPDVTTVVYPAGV